MCNFISVLPKNSTTMESAAKKRFLGITLKETPEGQVYRFRLIGFVTKNRDYPFIEKYVHTAYSTNPETGKNQLDDVVTCRHTRYAQNVLGDGEKCPICQFVDKQWGAYKQSGFKDKISLKKKNMFQRKYRAHALVYVVNDPNYEANNGKLRVITFYDQNEYKEFLKLIQKTMLQHNVFNGQDAVDFWTRLGTVEEKWYEGTPRETSVQRVKITDMGFSTRPYTIPEINSALVDSFPFDEEYFTVSSPEELMLFYKTYCVRPSVQVPMDDIVPSTKTPRITSVARTEPVKTEDLHTGMDDIDIDDLVKESTADSSAAPSEELPEKPNGNLSESDYSDIDDFINNLG